MLGVGCKLVVSYMSDTVKFLNHLPHNIIIAIFIMLADGKVFFAHLVRGTLILGDCRSKKTRILASNDMSCFWRLFMEIESYEIG